MIRRARNRPGVQQVVRAVNVLLILFMVCLAGCTAAGRFYPSAPNSHYAELVAQQLWHLEYRDERYRLPAMVSLDDNRLQVVLLDNFGQRIVTLSEQGGRVRAESHQAHPAASLWPRLFGAVRLIYWPLEDLQNSASASWRITESDETRHIFESDDRVAVVRYDDRNPWQGTARYVPTKDIFQLRVESTLLQATQREKGITSILPTNYLLL